MPDVHARLYKQILWVVLDRPPLNSLTAEMIDQLAAALHLAVDQHPKLVVITGTGERAFCAGVDLPDSSNSPDSPDAQLPALLRSAEDVTAVFDELRSHTLPTVALVKGIAFGAGCELVALCDVVIAREDARFRLPPVNAKVFTAATTSYLPAIIGQEATTKYMQSGETIDARHAFSLGLAHQVLSTQRFLADTEELLVMLATHP